MYYIWVPSPNKDDLLPFQIRPQYYLKNPIVHSETIGVFHLPLEFEPMSVSVSSLLIQSRVLW